MITFDTEPDRYRHWRLSCEDRVATLALDVAEEAGLEEGYRLKLNSYDLGVEIELADALNRIRFEHPQVRTVVVTSGKERIFCAGANIGMLAQASHPAKVNFCRFTNETRCGIEDASRHSGLKFIAAVNGACAGGGYELALACDEIVMVDDRSTTVSLPEVPLLGVLPGTGGLTRLVDKRRVRRDRADLFCTTAEGVRADRAKEWGLVDFAVPPGAFRGFLAERARALADSSDRPQGEKGVALPPLERRIDAHRVCYPHLRVEIARERRTATLLVEGPEKGALPETLDAILEAGASWWPLAMARAFDDAILLLRANEAEIGMLLFKTKGSLEAVLACDETMARFKGHWFVREVIGFLRRALRRLETTPKSLFALIDKDSCFAGSLFELALAADRSYMLGGQEGPRIALGPLNFAGLELLNGCTRLQSRFCAAAADAGLAELRGVSLDTERALERGLVSLAPDALDWEEEIRLAIEERASLSPDALSGLEANLRFAGGESPATKIFGRLSAWQNWIFARPNATGEEGALKSYGGGRPRFDRRRV
jgi:benzoyl-CoA-dihydrodiol lyase